MNNTLPSRFSIRNRRRVAIVATVSWIAYIPAFILIYPLAKEPIVALTIIPLGISGFALGPGWGFFVALFNIALNILLFRLAGRTDLLLASEWVLRAATGLVIPVATGWFGDLYYRLQERSEELAHERKMLRQVRAELETRVRERTAELQESEERYRVVSELASDYAFAMHLAPDGTPITEWVTGGFTRITGYAFEEISRWDEIVHPDDRETVRKRESGNADRNDEDEFRIITKSGEVRWLHSHLQPVWDPVEQRIVRVYGAMEDITARKRAEQALQESEARYRIISELTADFAYALRCEPDGRIAPEWFSAALGRATGFSEEELNARGGLPGLTYPADLPIAMKHIQTVRGGQPDTCEFRIIAKNGDVRWNLDYARPVWDETEQRVVRIYGAGQDITERKRAEDALRAANEYAASIIDSSLDMIVAVDQERKITEFNKAAQETFGYSRDEVLGKDVEMLFADARKGRGVNQALMNGERVRQEVWNQRRNGEVFPAMLSASALRNARGELIGSMGVSRDITERRRAEESLRASEARNLAIVQAIPDMVIRMSLEGVVLDFKPAAGMQIPIPPSALIGKSIHELMASNVRMPDGAIIELVGSMYRSLQSGKAQTFESTVPWEGISRHYETRLVVSGEKQVLGIVRDITERKQAEEERERLLEELRAGRERLIAVSQRLVEIQELERRQIARELHDQVGQSLTGLSINLNIILTQLPAGAKRQVETRMQDSLDLVDATVERIRDVMAELRPAVLDDYGLEAGLRWLGNRFTEHVRVRTNVQGAGVTPRLPIEKETALFRIAQEALNNIAKHAQAKQVNLTLETLDQQVRLTIADDGIGFDATAPRQVNAHMSWGLSLMRERARGVGGDMHIQSAPGNGTSIVVEMPR